MIISPVFITTLNRDQHLKKCIESLEECTWSDKTTVYVALDFPPSDNYFEGWRRTDSYLKEKEKKNNFKKLVVFRREFNLGLGENGNWAVLLKYACEHYKSFIVSEDDNVFSPNFLEYMNKGLELYEKSDEVHCICGYIQPYPFQFGGNNHFFHSTDMSAWGIGLWSKKYLLFKKALTPDFFYKQMSIKNYLKVRKHGYNRLLQFVSYAYKVPRKPFRLTDCEHTIYCILKDKYVVCPTVSKVRNIGWDALGQSFIDTPDLLLKMKNNASGHLNQKIDDSNFFDYQGNPITYFDYNNNLAAKVSEGRISWLLYIKSAIKYAVKFDIYQIKEKINSLFDGKNK